jgi:hypothetical protein
VVRRAGSEAGVGRRRLCAAPTVNIQLALEGGGGKLILKMVEGVRGSVRG